MTDELDARIRALNAERARPERKEPTVEELLRRLIGTLHALYKTPPDRKREPQMAGKWISAETKTRQPDEYPGEG